MAKRCEHCKHWIDTVFKGETPSGWGVWFGHCAIGMNNQHNSHSLNFACEKFEQKEETDAGDKNEI